ncbi:organic cation transporter protein-like [Dermacentor andersoni]|uniref:organic cation transporter protein-like n=1 Tax=Dermacentor andersoni TaxID=34620 RepID=UPI003B3BC76A
MSSPWDSPENLHKQRCHSWDYDIKDWGDSIVSRFDLVCDRKFLFTVASLLPTLSYAGLMPVAGFAADRLGRKPVSTISGCVLLVAVVGCSVAVNYTIFLVNRLVLITCGAFSYLTTFVLLYEVTGSAQRWVATLLHMAVAATVVPPFLNLLSAQEPSWSLAHVVFIVPTAVFATWCSQLDESPVWLLATRRVKKAKRVILAAARLNHVDEEKAKQHLQALCAELRKMQHSDDTLMLPSSLSDAVLEVIKMRRHAAAAFFSRFACGGVFFGLMITDTLSGLYWQGAHVAFSVACYIVITRAMNNYGPRHTLQGLLAATCSSAVARATSAYVGFDTAASCVRASMKILASGSVSVVMCYLGDIFPAQNRCTGMGLSIVIGGIGSIIGTSLASVRTVRPGFVFDVFYAVMMLLSIFAVQWLPEVFIEKPRSPYVTSPDERKMAMQASLKHKEKPRARHQRESKTNVGQRTLS